MKHLLVCFVFALAVMPKGYAGQCYDLYEDHFISSDYLKNKIDLPSGKAGLTILWVGGVSAGIALGGATGLAIAVLGPGVVASTVIGTVEGVKALANIKERKMMKLIEQANDYATSGTNPGRLLRKLHRSASGKMKVSLHEVAQAIVDGDETGSLCSESLPSFQALKRSLKHGESLLLQF